MKEVRPPADIKLRLGGGIKPRSWQSAGRIDTNVMNDKTNVYAKAGVAYRSNKQSDSDGSNTESVWAPIFGAGVSYDVRDNIYVALEMNYIGNNNDNTDLDKISPAASIYMAKVGYKFNF